MTNTGTYSIPLYYSSVDGLIIPTDKSQTNLVTKPQIVSPHYPITRSNIRTSYPSQAYPIHSNLLRSSTGSILHRVPNPRPLPTTILPPTNARWDSSINVIDFKTVPLVSQTKAFEKPMVYSSGNKLFRSESLKVSNSNSIKNDIIQQQKPDARYFCGLAPIQENRLLIRNIPSFRPQSSIISR